MTRPLARRSGILFWAATSCMATAWVIFLSMVAIGMTVHWPSWLMLAANSGMIAATALVPSSRGRGLIALAMGVLAIVAAAGVIAIRP